MRSFPFTLIRKNKLNTLTEEYASLQSQITLAADFIREIEKGNLEVRYHEEETLAEKDENDQLANSLISLRKQMVNVSLEEKQRSWVAETRSKFIDILRSKNNDLRELADDIIRHLVKCLSANQGGLYLVNDDDANDVHIELLACYAYERKKYIIQRIEIGHGLVGQTILEKESIYLTEIPENYLRITSGLGESTPRHLLIVPLKLEENVFGAIEIASFHAFKEHEIEFTEQIGESIASTIANVKNSQRTEKLLQETQQQAEEMRAQEEEVRQNMEELSATQEEMQRVMKEVQGNEAFMNDLINSTNDSVITIDTNYKVTSCNQATLDMFRMKELPKGFEILNFFEGEEKLKKKKLYDRVLSGEPIEEVQELNYDGKEQYTAINHNPIRNENKEIVGIAVFSKDITESVKSRQETEKLLQETQQQAEEMRAKEEELRQNMEELSATQEDMQRVMKEVQAKEMFLKDLIDSSSDSIFVIDKSYCLLDFNNTFQGSLSQMGVQVEKGGDVFMVLSEEERPKHKELYDRVFRGEAFEVTEHIAVADAYYMSSYSPLKDEKGEAYACVVFAKDITELVASKNQAEALLRESHQQGEELRAQEEELRQNMEELSATQEDMQRVMKEVQASEHYLKEILNVTRDTIYTLDRNARIITYNTFFEENMKQYGLKVEKGLDYLSILPSEEEKKSQKEIIAKVFKGKTIEIPLTYEVEGGEIHLISTYSPVRNAEGEIIAVAVHSKDVTELVMTKKQLR